MTQKFCHSYNTWNVLSEYSKILVGFIFYYRSWQDFLFSLLQLFVFYYPYHCTPSVDWSWRTLTPFSKLQCIKHHNLPQFNTYKPTKTSAILLCADLFLPHLKWISTWPSLEHSLTAKNTSLIKHWLIWIIWPATERQSNLQQYWHRCHRPI